MWVMPLMMDIGVSNVGKHEDIVDCVSNTMCSNVGNNVTTVNEGAQECQHVYTLMCIRMWMM